MSCQNNSSANRDGGWNLVRLSTVDSTNEYVKRRRDILPDRTVVTARTQTGGKGRQGKEWLSPPGGLYASLLYEPAPPPEIASRVSLLLACLLCRIGKQEGLPMLYKWPNDLVVEGGKVAGILPELSGQPQPGLVVGLGVNLSTMPRLESSEGLPPTAWSRHGTAPSADRLLERLLAMLDREWLNRSTDPLAGVRRELEERLWARGETVEVHEGKRSFKAVLTGLTDEGHLVLKTPEGDRSIGSGTIRPVTSG
ncbi:biotin--[acetyl-CoA-carboxylase] ligase [Candidatus Fermentibacteria bacterium]|nr:biotin--[acetyl-CoA-carboxylase] ligase [Candidatus Fermentibacteria bacterium]